MTSSDDDLKTVYLALNGRRTGPYSPADLRRQIRMGELADSVFAWRSGMATWLPLRDVLGDLPPVPPPPPTAPPESGKEFFADITGLERLEGFSLRRFFAGIFARHTPEEVTDFFCMGGSDTRLPLSRVQTEWPSPWIFTRLMLLAVVLYVGFYWGVDMFRNLKLVPGCIFVGNFGIPFCIMVLFMELNVYRHVSFYAVLKAFMLGGLLAIFIALFLFGQTGFSAAPLAGIIEEPAKLAAAVLIGRRMMDGRALTGLLLGSAVGAGFAAFESAGYTFESIIAVCMELKRDGEAPVDPGALMQMRAVLSPFCHVVWTAITAGGLWLMMGRQKEEGKPCSALQALREKRLLALFAVPVLLHTLWNCDWVQNFGIVSYGLLGLAAWITALRLVQAGLRQAAKEKSEAGL